MRDEAADKGERAERRRQAFMAAVNAAGISLRQLASKAGIPATTLYSYAQGETRSLRGPAEVKLAQALDTKPGELFGDVTIKGAMVEGLVGDTGQVSIAGQPLYEIDLPFTVYDDHERYRAFELAGLYMPPAEAGWTIIFKSRGNNIPSDVLGQPCLVELADGRTFFRRLRRSLKNPSKFDLEAWNGQPPIDEVEVLSAMPFVMLTPGKRQLEAAVPRR